MKSNSLLIVLVFGFSLIFSIGRAQIQSDSIKVSDPFHYVRLFTDSNDVSHFLDEELLFKLVDFAPPAPPISVSEVMNSSGKTFIISSPSGWFGDWQGTYFQDGQRRTWLYAGYSTFRILKIKPISYLN